MATVLRERHGRVELVERVSIQPKGRAYSRTMFQRGERGGIAGPCSGQVGWRWGAIRGIAGPCSGGVSGGLGIHERWG